MANIGLPDDFSISAPLFDSVGIAPYGPTVQQFDPIQDLRDRHDDNRREIEQLKDIAVTNDMRNNEQDRQLYEIREQVKEALAVLYHPGLIANRVLDKVDAFIAKYKKVLTDKQGKQIEMIEVFQLEGMVRQLREVIKNGNNNEGL